MSQKWYNFLVPSQTEEMKKCLLVSEIVLPNNLIICQQNGDYRRFTLFNDFVDFYNFLEKSSEKTFYEVIRNQPQKPYFDIDLDENDYSLEQICKIMNDITQYLHEFCEKLTRTNFCIMVFSSHGEGKISFHIVIDGIYVSGFKQNKLFYENFMETCPYDIFDSKIYSRIQQFRTLFSKKFGTNRIKMPDFGLFYNKDKTRGWYSDASTEKQWNLFLFRSSLVTVVNESEFISFPEPVIERNFFSSSCIDISTEHIEKALELFREKSGYETPFKFCRILSDDESHSIVSLKRLSPSFCPVCERIHKNENPFLLFWSEYLHVSFDCRRNDSKRYYIGSLVEKKEIIEDEPVKKQPEYLLLKQIAHKPISVKTPKVKRKIQEIKT